MIRIAAVLFFCLSMAYAQDTSNVKNEYKFTATYGINWIMPEKVNDHITYTNNLLESSTKIIKNIPEAAVSLSTWLIKGHLIITGRIGRMCITRTFDTSIPETTTSPNITEYTSGTIEEIYTIYPLSIGLGLASNTLGSQIQLEYIYALGYIDEKQSYRTSAGARNSYSEAFSSSAYGIRLAGSTIIFLTDQIGLTLEASYRYFILENYSSDITGKSNDIEFQAYGLNGAIGLSILF